MKQWFYSKDGAQQGPVGEDVLTGMIRSGALPASTLVWSEGMSEWTQASGLAQFSFNDAFAPQVGAATAPAAESFSPYAPPTVASEAPLVPVGTSGSQVRPWVRMWARTIDVVLIAFTIGVGLALVYPEALEIPEMLLNILVLAATTVVEAAMFALFGTTPGKAIFRITVRKTDGSRMNFIEAWVRSLLVFVKGMGLGIPLAALITQIVAYSKLSSEGVTSWDRDRGLEVSHQEIQAWRWLLIVLVLFAAMALIIYGSVEE